ncbi:MAG: hypothetical protein SGPRY_003978 [Prymnesium sp.]
MQCLIWDLAAMSFGFIVLMKSDVMQKLMMQQRELMNLRAAIEEAKAGKFAMEDDDKLVTEVDEKAPLAEAGDDEAETQMHHIFATLMAKKRELDQLLATKAELEAELAQPPPSLPSHPPSSEPLATSGGMSSELSAMLQARQEEKAGVEEQEKKLAELNALQSALRNQRDALDREETVDGLGQEEEEAPAGAQGSNEAEEMARKLLGLITVKTLECEKLATVVEEARSAGMAAENPRLQAAERSLAARYLEVKELAAIAERLGIDMEQNTGKEIAPEAARQLPGAEQEASTEREAKLRTQAEQAAVLARDAFEKMQRLEGELQRCQEQLQSIDESSSDAVLRHPAFQRMRASVHQKIVSLRAQADEAYAAYEKQANLSREAASALTGAGEDEQEEMELTPLLKDALDNLWQRPYECKVFTLQLLQALAELDDRSVCMMSSCFARYIETHSAPAA